MKFCSFIFKKMLSGTPVAHRWLSHDVVEGSLGGGWGDRGIFLI